MHSILIMYFNRIFQKIVVCDVKPYFQWLVVISYDVLTNFSDFQSTHTTKQNLNMH